jgi:hypothetical protein
VPLFNTTMFNCTHVVVRIVPVGIVVWCTCTVAYSTGFAGTDLGASAMGTAGASLSGRGAMAGGARGGFRLGSEDSAGMRVRFDREAMDNDKSHLLSSAPSSSWLPPFFPTVCLLEWAARPASRDGLICGLDCRNGSRNPWLTSFCWPDVLRNGGESIGCVVYHPSLSLSLPLPLAALVCGRHTPTSIYSISDSRGLQEAIGTQIPLSQCGRWALLPHCQSAGSIGFARSID